MESLVVLIILILIAFIIQVAILRWVFRINTQIRLLTEIRDLLKQSNICGERSRTTDNHKPVVSAVEPS